MRFRGFLLALALAGSLATQEKSKWLRVHTYDDAVIEMEEIKALPLRLLSTSF